MSKLARRRFSREFKRQAVERIRAGEPIRFLAVEFAVHRQLLYKWRDAFALGEPRRRGRPSKAEALAMAAGTAGLSEAEIARRTLGLPEFSVNLQQKTGRRRREAARSALEAP